MDPTAFRLECLRLSAALSKSAAEMVEIAERLYAFVTKNDSKAAERR
jgi:hypothetical protein